jgi:hypothetical protein
MLSNCVTRLSYFVCLGLAALALSFAAPCRAQDIASPKVVWLAGAGAAITHDHSLGAMQTGISFEGSTPNKWFGLGFESGYVGPYSNLKSGSGFMSFNYVPSWQADKKGRFVPFASAGYTRLFEIGHAVNFGGGLDLRLNNLHAIRFEARDYYMPTRPEQHNVAFRIGWVVYVQD